MLEVGVNSLRSQEEEINSNKQQVDHLLLPWVIHGGFC